MAKRKNPFQPLLDRIPAPARNRYFMVSILFLAWMVFFDKHDILTQFRLQATLERLKADKGYYQEKIEEAKADKIDIERDKEKFAREHYYMHKDDEDIFIFVEE